MAKRPNSACGAVGPVHNSPVSTRRIRSIADAVAPLLRPARRLDVGRGHGSRGRLLAELRSHIRVAGLERMARPHRPADWAANLIHGVASTWLGQKPPVISRLEYP